MTFLCRGVSCSDWIVRTNALKSHEIRTALEQARRIGAHSFWFNVRGSRDYVAMLLQLFGAFKDCAFMLMLNGTQLTRELTQLARAQLNTMICIDQSSHATTMQPRCCVKQGYCSDFRLHMTTQTPTLHWMARCWKPWSVGAVTSRCFCEALSVQNAAGSRCISMPSMRACRPARPAFMVDVFDDMAQVDRNISSALALSRSGQTAQ